MTQTLIAPPRFEFNPESGVLFFPSRKVSNGIVSEPMEILYTTDGQKRRIRLNDWREGGKADSLKNSQIYQLNRMDDGLMVHLFTWPDQGCWKLKITNLRNQPIQIERLEMLKNGRIRDKGIKVDADFCFFENGWQSWSYSAAYGAEHQAKRTGFDWLYPGMWAANGTPTPRQTGLFAGDFFGVLIDRNQQSGWVAGFLAQREQFGTIVADLRGLPVLNLWANFDEVVLPPAGSLETDRAVVLETCLQSDRNDNDPLEEYVRMVAQENQARVPKAVPAGWCSWYHFFQKVSAEDIRRNIRTTLNHRSQWPLDLVQIDDGYETAVGDWEHFNGRFPEGLVGLASEIKCADLMAGIWLAPFIFQPQSVIAQQHPEWMIQGKNGRPRFAGFNWNSRTVALDLTHPEAQVWLRQTIQRAVKEWGFSYLKLDFLYAGGLSGKRLDPTRTNAQALNFGLKVIREEAGEDVFLLGCGCPLGPGVGVFDAMRISADTAPTWGNHYFGMSFPFLAEPHAPSAENALHNVLTRANFHQRWWWNDPDCILLRPESQLNLTEIQTVASVIALTGGMLLVSDDLERLPEERQTILSQMLPPIQSAGRVLDALTESKPKSILWEGADATGSYALVAMINWENTPKPLTFDPRAFMRSGRQFLSSFWDGQVVDLAADQCTIFINIPAHGTVLLAVRNAIDEVPIQYLGGNLHISQGLELRDMRFDEAGFELQLDLPRTWRGEVRLWVKRCPREMRTEKAVLESWQVINHILRMTVSGEGRAKISGGW